MIRPAIIIASLAGLCACVQIWPEPAPAPDVFRIEPGPPDFDAPSRPNLVISVREPITSKELSGAQLVMQQPGGRVAYVARAEWTDAAPVVLQTLWIATLERSGKVKAGVRGAEGVRATCDIVWDLHAFEGREGRGGDLDAHIAFSVRAIDPQARQVRAQQRFEISIPSQTNRTSLAAALGQAARTALAEASAWALTDGCPPGG